ncbi:hypothetical protein ABVK25_012537 [Lepraria finkii]|uniref:Uncharacterized protein n=1 Tax=Lepraria finkii TaxID=1340010 RepID=A0ABR4AFT8_9LECA
MAKMLDGPVPNGARSVSWPWYHHTLTTELTVDARKLLEQYSKILPEDVESHIYRIRDKAWGVFPWPCVGEFWFLCFGLAKHPLYHTMVLPRLKSGDSLLDLGACLGQDLRKCVFDGAPPDRLYASDLFAEYEDLSYELWRDRDTFPNHFLADDVLSDNGSFMQGNLMMNLGPGQTDMIVINMFLHLFDYSNQLKVATRILRLLSPKPGSIILGSQAGVVEPIEQPLKPPFDKTEDGRKRTIFRHSPESFIQMWEDAGKAAGVPLRPITCEFQKPEATEASAAGVDTGLEAEEKKPFTADDLFSKEPLTRPKVLVQSAPETGRLHFSVIRS